MDERILLAGAQRFDSSSLAMIYDQYSPVLYAYAMRLLGDADLAEDCVAETFARFLKALQAGQGPKEYLRAYLYRVAHNWITDRYRREPPPPLELDEELQSNGSPTPERTAELLDRQERLRRALRLLTHEQRQVIVLRFIEDCPADEVAKALGKPLGAIKSLQHRALNTLHRLLWQEE